jgi:hypothetical protein
MNNVFGFRDQLISEYRTQRLVLEAWDKLAAAESI